MQNNSGLACVAGDAKTEGGIRRERQEGRESGGGGGGEASQQFSRASCARTISLSRLREARLEGEGALTSFYRALSLHASG